MGVQEVTCYDPTIPHHATVREGVPPLPREGSGPSLDFDAHPRAFGSFQVRATFGDGRFGPVFLAEDAETGRRVVVRTFSESLPPEQQTALTDALHTLCELPLDHPSVARPLAAGIQDGVPYLVHAYLEGTPADEFLATHGPQRLADLAPRITQAAAAIDFAAAAAVHHGELTLRDVIIGPQSTGISGFGLYQALGQQSTSRDDVQGLARVTLRLLDERDHAQLGAVVSNPPDTALAFAAAIQQIAAGSAIDAGTDLGTALNVVGPIATVTPAAAATDLPIGAPASADEWLERTPFADAPLASHSPANAPVADVPLADAPLHEDGEFLSESAGDVPLRANAVTSSAEPEPVTPRSTTGAAERRNGLFAASAKGEVDRANDQAARARDEAARAKQEAARARDEAERAKAEAARAREAAARATRPDPVSAQPAARVDLPIRTQSTLFSAAAHDAPPRVTRRTWIPLTIAAALVIGLLAGFGGGYFVGQQDRPSTAVPAAAPEPTATNGQAYTDSPLRDSGSAVTDRAGQPHESTAAAQQPRHDGDQAATTPPKAPDGDQTTRGAASPPRAAAPDRDAARESRSRTADARTRAPRAAQPATGALFVDSHPSGAQVFVDGALVGRTPLLLNDVRSGAHRVRLALPLHRTWATSVDVTGGERTRVAASLEEGQE